MSEHRTPERVMALYLPLCENAAEATDEHRLWRAVLTAVQQVVPGAAELSPGWCAMRARGPARYYGSEEAAANEVLECAVHTVEDHLAQTVHGSVGVANGRFAAEQAAGLGLGVHVIAAEHTNAFLSPLPVARACTPELTEVLLGLGVRTLGALAALPEAAVQQRFGAAGVLAHRRARGLADARTAEVPPPAPLRDLRVDASFETPLDGADQLAFAVTAPAETFVRRLAGQGLVCTELLVRLSDDNGIRHERLWAHPTNFTASDIVNRVRWQSATLPSDPGRGGAGIVEIQLTPASTASAAAHEPGLWSTAPDQRVHHQLTRVQSLVGHEGVGTGTLTGGRLTADRAHLQPWGTAEPDGAHRPHSGPWPGQLTGALPNTVFTPPLPAELRSAQGSPVGIDDDDLLTEPPARFAAGSARVWAVRAWSAPWPLRERHWHRTPPATAHRLQVVLENGEAWLLRHTTHAEGAESAAGTAWVAEAHYA